MEGQILTKIYNHIPERSRPPEVTGKNLIFLLGSLTISYKNWPTRNGQRRALPVPVLAKTLNRG
jgi:hypothetical protein